MAPGRQLHVHFWVPLFLSGRNSKFQGNLKFGTKAGALVLACQWYKEAEDDARQRCTANGKLAPWGCMWFELWRRNVERAVERKQKLLVYFFRGEKGQGKVAWKDLKNPNERNDGTGQSRGVPRAQCGAVYPLHM